MVYLKSIKVNKNPKGVAEMNEQMKKEIEAKMQEVGGTFFDEVMIDGLIEDVAMKLQGEADELEYYVVADIEWAEALIKKYNYTVDC